MNDSGLRPEYYAGKGIKMMNQENQEIEYIDENGHQILPAGFDVKKSGADYGKLPELPQPPVHNVFRSGVFLNLIRHGI